MPSNSAPPKIAAARGYSASVTFCEPNATARQTTCDRIQKETGATFVPPYDSARTIVGQGTIWLEIEQQVKEMGLELSEIGAVVVPVGGGGLLAGVCIAAAASGVSVYGAGQSFSASAMRTVADLALSHSPTLPLGSPFPPLPRLPLTEPKGADDCARGIASGERIPDLVPHTIADGLRTPVGVLNFPIIKQHVKGIITVTEEVCTFPSLCLARSLTSPRSSFVPLPVNAILFLPLAVRRK